MPVNIDMERKIYNPIQKDSVVFIKTAADTANEYTLVEVELADGGGVGLHYHKTYSEHFECLEGEVQVQLGKTMNTLSPGQSATALPRVNHLFRNRSGKPCRFRVEIRPACRVLRNPCRSGTDWPLTGYVIPMVFQKTNWRWPGCSASAKATCPDGEACLNLS